MWEGGAGDASLYGKGRGPVTSQKAAARGVRRAGLASPGRRGRKRKEVGAEG